MLAMKAVLHPISKAMKKPLKLYYRQLKMQDTKPVLKSESHWMLPAVK
jgi:hypothetical protein